MKWLPFSVVVAGLFLVTTADAQQAERQNPTPWSQYCGMGPWPMGPGMMGGMEPMAGSMPPLQ
ncbi:hypothetical protein HQ394_19380 (plasmid) [Defluviicoccus vanus]|uniref:Uncharacterized protein n=1 Tax=Defluviicoccus vanus TaxID=111831 RepID=A0A7H1N709_9PROT|nr:hypothetical protein HQ394_19380 [Defluviicoccus vanus]